MSLTLGDSAREPRHVTVRPPRLYLDTCIISGIAKEDLQTDQRAAVTELLRLHKQKVIQLVTSEMAKVEIDKIPVQHRSKHEAIYSLLADVSSFVPLTGLSVIGIPTVNWHWIRLRALKRILPGHLDARHVFAAWRHGLEYFVTTDESTILRHRQELMRQFGVKAMLPAEVLEILRHT
jgi:hypothetical protein